MTPSKFIPSYKTIEEYYGRMLASDIVNRNAHFLIGIEDTRRRTDIKICIACSILCTFAAYSVSQAELYSSLYKITKFQHSRGSSACVCDIVLDNGLLTSSESVAPTLQGAMSGRVNIVLDPKQTDPHTLWYTVT
eukprot:5889795-Ditylum_brightwellii.AAC.1